MRQIICGVEKGHASCGCLIHRTLQWTEVEPRAERPSRVGLNLLKRFHRSSCRFKKDQLFGSHLASSFVDVLLRLSDTELDVSGCALKLQAALINYTSHRHNLRGLTTAGICWISWWPCYLHEYKSYKNKTKRHVTLQRLGKGSALVSTEHKSIYANVPFFPYDRLFVAELP
jgi:hypothetical protein